MVAAGKLGRKSGQGFYTWVDGKQAVTAVRVEERADRVVVTLNRPDKRNAIDAELVEELHEVCAGLETDPKLMLLTGGTDGVFAGGADIAQLRDRGRLDALAAINMGLFERIRRLPMPTLAAIDGPALGGGAELAYACDLRVCTRARVLRPARGAARHHRRRRCLLPAAGPGRRRAGQGVAVHRPPGPADEALAVRLVNRVVESRRSCCRPPTQLLDDIADASPLAVRLTKQAVDAPAAAHPQLDLASPGDPLRGRREARPDDRLSGTSLMERR